MKKMDYAITFACFNQIEYTKQFVDSLIRTGIDMQRVCAVDNGSTDGTRDYLQTLGLGQVILNKHNLGCGTAWNQGALALQAEWTVVMNNDVICPEGWLENLISAAEKHQLDVASPALVEGPLSYDFADFSHKAMQAMQDSVRRQEAHGVCMLVHTSVWQKSGYFYSIPRLLGFEDFLFFNDIRKAGLRYGTVGASWLHHFGSITQKAVALETNTAGRNLGDQLLMKQLLGQNWLLRKWNKFRRKQATKHYRQAEISRYNMTLRGESNSEGEIRWL